MDVFWSFLIGLPLEREVVERVGKRKDLYILYNITFFHMDRTNMLA